MSEFSRIACEVCRVKKRKCDREIPTCSQCIHASQMCTYPGTNKRGLPSGYLASLEERLAQTEAALIQALSLIYAPGTRHGLYSHTVEEPDPPTEKPRELEFNEVRIARVEEWNKYPLNTTEQQQDWMRNKIATIDANGPDLVERSEEAIDVTSGPRRRQRTFDTALASKRRKTPSQRRETPNLGVGCLPDPTVLTSSPSTSRPVSGTDDAWIGDTSHDIPLDPLPTSVSSLHPQNADTQYRASLDTSDTARNFVSEDTSASRQEPQPEQHISKAKKLVTSQSRRYF